VEAIRSMDPDLVDKESMLVVEESGRFEVRSMEKT
jgi:hypothetical protein